MQFEDLQLIDSLLRAVREEGYDTPTPIQQQSIPYVLEGRDLLGTAQTGTGKTAAFALPILQQLAEADFSKDKRRPIRALVIAPTRELATQNLRELPRIRSIHGHEVRRRLWRCGQTTANRQAATRH
jgi:ATP-dependent RNA helicase RhlE